VLAYLLRKILLAIPLLWGVLTLTFLLVELMPGDYCDAFVNEDMDPTVIAQIRVTMGCDEPMASRYVHLLGQLLTGHLGASVKGPAVADLIAAALPNTLLLAFVTILVAQTFGASVGVVQAIRQHRWQDTTLAIATLAFYSMPGFWLALMLQLVFARHWQWLPASGAIDSVMYDFLSPGGQLLDRAKHLVLPGLAMGLAAAAGDARYMRSSMLDVIRQDFIRTARAKGLPEVRVILKHALRNALLPLVTLLGLNLPALFSGSVLVETVFAWPGMGRLIFEAVRQADTPVIMACFLVYTLLVVGGNLLADLLYAVVDPRIRYA
jgi:peptide/nickel transport system permease protein